MSRYGRNNEDGSREGKRKKFKPSNSQLPLLENNQIEITSMSIPYPVPPTPAPPALPFIMSPVSRDHDYEEMDWEVSVPETEIMKDVSHILFYLFSSNVVELMNF